MAAARERIWELVRNPDERSGGAAMAVDPVPMPPSERVAPIGLPRRRLRPADLPAGRLADAGRRPPALAGRGGGPRRRDPAAEPRRGPGRARRHGAERRARPARGGLALPRSSPAGASAPGSGRSTGFAIGLYPIVRSSALPIVSALFAMPKIALLPVFIVWFGIGETSKIATIAVGVFSPMAIAAYSGVDGVDRSLIRMAQSFDLPTARHRAQDPAARRAAGAARRDPGLGVDRHRAADRRRDDRRPATASARSP